MWDFSAKRATISGMREPTFINPISLPEKLNTAERKFVQCMAEGGKCEIGTKRPTEAINKGDNANVIRADVIRFFVWGGSKDDPIAGNTITLGGAHISGALDLVLVSSPYALALIDCRFDAPVKMLHAAFRSLHLNGSYLPHGLNGYGMRIDSDMFMRDGFSAEGEVRLLGADIGGNVDCDGGKFINKKGIALAADRIKVGGNFSMQNNFTAEGEIRLLSADIGGDVYCNSSKLRNEKGDALAADKIKVGGNFSLRSGFSADGTVRLPAADINGSLYCISSEFKRGLNARAARVRNFLYLRNLEGNGTVDLSFAATDVLEDDEKSRENFAFRLGGFSYQRFGTPGEVEVRIKKWLDKHPDDIDFSPQPFEQAAKVLFAMGHNNDARAVLWAKERRLTKHGKLPSGHKPIRWVWSWLAGYGYRLRRTLAWSAGIVFAGAAIFYIANESRHIVPHQPVVLKMMQESVKVQKGGECASKKRPTEVVKCLIPEYPRFYSLTYSLDVFIPFFALHQEQYWYPQPSANAHVLWRVLLPIWYWIEIIAGWVFTSLLVLTITGLLKPRQSSLE